MLRTTLRRHISREARRTSIITVIATLVLTTTTAAVPATASDAEATIEFSGSGWGHGVGMSQYGAKGQALEGRTAEEIATHYFTGTEIAATDALPIPNGLQDRPLWVGLNQHLTTATVAWSTGGGTVCIDPGADGSDASCRSTVAIAAGDRFTAAWDSAQQACTLVRTRDEVPNELKRVAADCRLSVHADRGATMWFEARGYPAGATIELRRAPSSNDFHVVAAIDIEDYVAGIAEVPDAWPAAAIEAQALAARSFALNRYLAHEKPEMRNPGDAGLTDAVKDTCWCHVYDDTRSQVYGGVEHVTPARAAAAEATADRVIAYRGADWSWFTRYQVIEAYYSSSTGGMSLSNTVAWGSPTQYPYLQTVDDPWSTDGATGNPNAAWEDTITAADLAAKLGWDTVTAAELISSAPPTVRVHGIDGGATMSIDLRGDKLRGTAGLLSGYVHEVRMSGAPVCRGRFGTITGTQGRDELTGTDGDDVIIGLAGNDVIRGGGGNDLICGGGGRDHIAGNGGDDTIDGGPGNDRIRGGGGYDTIRGRRGDDLLEGGHRADVIYGHRGDDTIMGGKGRDVVHGGLDDDVVEGGPGRDQLFGWRGDDQLFGDDHADALRGGPGADLLDGGSAADECRGGIGVDEAANSCEVVVGVP